MVDISKLKVGQKVHYQPDQYKKTDSYENGIVKEIPEHTNESVRVVYYCNEDWDNYQNYTSALTNIRDLNEGWILMKFRIEVVQLVPDEALSYKDSEDNPSGEYYELSSSLTKALDQFNERVPISIPEHFKINSEVIGEELVGGDKTNNGE
jgi:hypothetical protein